MPKRLQRKRTKGSRLPEGCVCVTRPGKWGNPFTGEGAVERFRELIYDDHLHDQHGKLVAYVPELRGKDLACWCKLCPKHKDGLPLGVKCAECKPCHADPLLIEANK